MTSDEIKSERARENREAPLGRADFWLSEIAMQLALTREEAVRQHQISRAETAERSKLLLEASAHSVALSKECNDQGADLVAALKKAIGEGL